MELVVAVYKFTQGFPKEEIYGLSSQMRRAAVSVPSNLAEGAANRSTDHFKNHLRIALGSLNELDTQMEIAIQLNYGSANLRQEISGLLDECLALTYGLKRSIQ